MYVLCSNIRIGNVSFASVHEVQISRSIYNPAATAVIKIPVTAALKQADNACTHIETANEIHVGDAVEIRLGYDNRLNLEFTGFVKQLNYKRPLEIECEDAYFKTRSLDCVFSQKETTLKACLNALLPGIPVGYCTDLTLKNFVVNHKPAAWVLGYLKKEYGLTVFFDLNGNLYAGEAFRQPAETVKYRLRYNVIGDDSLKYQQAKDTPVKVQAVCYRRDGARIESGAGEEGGETKTLTFYDVKNVAELKKLAEEEVQRHSYDGYRGKIETFLEPYALPGMAAQVDDPVYPERSGTYYIESAEVRFGASGGRRAIEIGRKI